MPIDYGAASAFIPFTPFMLIPLSLLLLTPTAPPAGTAVAVGYGGRRLVSADANSWDVAAEWAANGGDDSDNLMSVVYAKRTASPGPSGRRRCPARCWR